MRGIGAGVRRRLGRRGSSRIGARHHGACHGTRVGSNTAASTAVGAGAGAAGGRGGSRAAEVPDDLWHFVQGRVIAQAAVASQALGQVGLKLRDVLGLAEALDVVGARAAGALGIEADAAGLWEKTLVSKPGGFIIVIHPDGAMPF